MRSYRWLRIVWTVVGLILLLTAGAAAIAAPDAAMYAKCAKACKECTQSCKECNAHCAGMVKSGMKEHTKSLQLSADCADICALAAKLCDRKGPLAPSICEACEKACDVCRTECHKYPTMKPMAACDRACDACAKVCKEMMSAAK
jgi:hypothetical protein